jgi:O-antigen/teichoic acid export membrane protein
MTIPIAVVIVMGDEFFSLWVPSQDAKLLQTLSVLAILGYMFTSGTQILYNVFATVNKVKQNAIAMIISGVVSCALTLIIIMFTDMDIYAVAGVSTFVNLVRNMTFTLPSTARYLGFKWTRFYPQVGMTCFSSVLLIVVGYLVKPFLPSGSWLDLIISAAVLGIIGLIANCMIVLNKDERRFLFTKVKAKIRR